MQAITRGFSNMCIEHANQFFQYPASMRQVERRQSGVYTRVEPPLENRIDELGRAAPAAFYELAIGLALEVVERLEANEGPEGLITHIDEVAPQMRRQVALLREQNHALRVMARALYRYGRCGAPRAMMHVLLEQLADALRQNGKLEAELLQEAILAELGIAG